MSKLTQIDLEYYRFVMEWGADLERREFSITGDINEATADRVHSLMNLLEQINHEPVLIRLSSFGGILYDGYAIYDRLLKSPCYVTIEAWGPVQSAATIIIQAADRRVLAPNSQFLIHYGSLYEEQPANETETMKIILTAEEQKREHRRMENFYLPIIRESQPKFTRTQLQQLLSQDKTMTPSEAIKLGLADEVMGIKNLKRKTKRRRKTK